MSQDLIFGFTKKNWSRTPPKAVHECGPEMCMVSYQKAPLTDDEKSKLDQLARVKMKAESGDRPAQRQWKDITLKMSSLKSKSKKGDPKAKHTLEILEDSGLFGHVQKISGIAPRAIEDDPGMDLVERMILRAGTTRGWPVYVKKQDYEDWKLRAGKGETSASSTFNIINRYVKQGKVRVDGGNRDERLTYAMGRLDSDEIAAARDGGDCEVAALSRVHGNSGGIVISDREIKDAMRGSVSLVEGGRRRHRRHRRRFPGQLPGQAPGQYPNQGASTYVPSRDAQKSQIVRSLYRQIKQEHINWMIIQDQQNGIYNQTADKYQQAARAWARDQLQQQQLPTRLTASGSNQWYQPVTWFQSQAQAVLNNSSGQRSTQTNASTATATAPYPSYQYAAPAPQAANAYYPSTSAPSSYPAPGSSSTDDPSLYDDDQQGWPSPLLMHGDFVGDEARAEGENSSSCGNDLPHSQYRALVMKQAIRNAGGKKPSTKHLFAAKKAVDNALGASGVAIYIPGAGPMRRTV